MSDHQIFTFTGTRMDGPDIDIIELLARFLVARLEKEGAVCVSHQIDQWCSLTEQCEVFADDPEVVVALYFNSLKSELGLLSSIFTLQKAKHV